MSKPGYHKETALLVFDLLDNAMKMEGAGRDKNLSWVVNATRNFVLPILADRYEDRPLGESSDRAAKCTCAVHPHRLTRKEVVRRRLGIVGDAP